jgi:hypothetical protein
MKISPNLIIDGETMTKKIRIENADCNANYRVQIHHQERGVDGWQTVRSEEVHPVQIVDLYIHDGKRIIVEEMSNGPALDGQTI